MEKDSSYREFQANNRKNKIGTFKWMGKATDDILEIELRQQQQQQ